MQLSVGAALREQIFVVARLYDLPLPKHDDPGGGEHRRQAAGDHHAGAPAQHRRKARLDRSFGGVNHAYHNDTGPRYNPEQAAAAWSRMLVWLDQYV